MFLKKKKVEEKIVKPEVNPNDYEDLGDYIVAKKAAEERKNKV